LSTVGAASSVAAITGIRLGNEGFATVPIGTLSPNPSDKGPHTVSTAIQTLNDATFAETVGSASTPVLVDFWAEWCGPCKMIGPALEELASEYEGKIKVAKVNVDENPGLPAQYGVRGIPALFMFKDGEVVSNRTGAAPKASLKGWIDESV